AALASRNSKLEIRSPEEDRASRSGLLPDFGFPVSDLTLYFRFGSRGRTAVSGFFARKSKPGNDYRSSFYFHLCYFHPTVSSAHLPLSRCSIVSLAAPTLPI